MSIANKLSYLNDTKEEIREGLNRLGGGILPSDTFRSYASALDDIYDSMPKVEGNDVTSATLNGTIKGGLDIDLKGNTSQYTTTGKNLCINYAVGGSNDDYLYINVDKTKVNQNNLTLSLITGETLNNSLYIKIGSGSATYMTNVVGSANQKQIANITLTNEQLQEISNASTLQFYIYKSNANWGTISEVQLEIGSSATSYEPYTNGASPSPSYPQPINVVSGDNEVVVCGINIWDEEWEVGSLNYTTGVKESDVSRVRSKNYIPIIPNTTYYMYGGYGAGRECFYDKDKNHISSTSVYNNTFTTPNNAYYLMFTTGSGYGGTYNNDICINVSNASIDGHYYPYQSQTYPINLGTLELCKIGTYQDYFTKNSGKNLVEETLEHSNLNSSGTIVGGSGEVYDLHIAKVIEGQNYTITTKESGADIVLGFFNTKPIMSSQTYNQERVITRNTTFTAPITGYVAFRSVTGYLFAMLNEGSTALPYEPYGTGQWCKYNAIEEVTLASSQFNEKGTTGTNAYYISTTIANGLNDNSVASSMSNKFGMVAFNNRQNGLDVTYVQNGRIYIRTKNNTSLDWSTNQNCKDWLDANSPIIDYILASPYLSLIEDTNLCKQLDEVEKAMSKQGQTNISQVNNDIAFKLDLKAILDWRNNGGE